MNKTYITIYTKQKGKQRFTERQWSDFDPFVEYHREDGPAIIYCNGDKEWFLNGKRHREDGPAFDWPGCEQSWWIENKRHREDGPAIITNKSILDARSIFYIDDIQYKEEEFNDIIKQVDSLEPALGLTDPRDWVRRRFERLHKNA